MKPPVIASLLLLTGCAPGSADVGALLYAAQNGDRLETYVDFTQNGGDPARGLPVHVEVTFRGETKTFDYPGSASANVPFLIDGGFVPDEPIAYDLTLDGEEPISLTFNLAPISIAPIPLFVSRETDLELSWSPSVSTPMNWNARGCAHAIGSIPANATNLTIPSDSFFGPQTCTARVQLEMFQDVPIETAFDGGGFFFTQRPEVIFASTR